MIKLNGDDAYNEDYSRLILASTLIHEAYHVNILQRVFSTYGTQTVNDWSVPPLPADPVLLELYQAHQYYLGLGQSLSLADLEHEWMTHHLDELASALKSFTEANYPASASAAGSSLDSYKALFLLHDGSIRNGPNRYRDQEVSALGGRAGIEDLYRLLNGPANTNAPIDFDKDQCLFARLFEQKLSLKQLIRPTLSKFCLMKSGIWWLIYLLSGLNALGQSLEGKILDQCNLPVSYATLVSKKMGTVYAIANRDGFFKISNVLPGDTLVCSQTDYTTKEEKVVGNNLMNIYLERRILQPYKIDLAGKGKNQTPPPLIDDLKPTVHISEHLKVRAELHSAYAGGADSLQRFLNNILTIPEEQKHTNRVKEIKLRFFVEPDGSVTDIVLLKGVNETFDQQVISAIAKTVWFAAEQNGRKVRSRQEVAIIL